MHLDIHAFLTGATTGFGLIVAIGAQNAWVIRQGIRREGVGLVVAICIACDALLIATGTLGINTLTRAAPGLLVALRWAGVAYLLHFAVASARAALSADKGMSSAPEAVSRGTIARTTLGVTLLNPHVYLDTVLMLGTVTNSFGAQRWTAALGAMSASALWFASIGAGAARASRLLEGALAWRIIDGLIAFVMLALALRLALG